jgi:hypothetical protein
MKYVHTNLFAKSWRLLSDFYIKVFDCEPLPPERDLKGEYLGKATGVKNAALREIHLLLPGFGKDGPSLEIFQYKENEGKLYPVATEVSSQNRICGYKVDILDEDGSLIACFNGLGYRKLQ